MGRSARKQELDETTETEVQTRLSAVKRAKSLDELLAALHALPQGEAGPHALRRLQLPFKNFGGAPPEEGENALSWDPGRLLVVEESLDDAKLIARRGASAEAPRSRMHPKPTNDAGEDTDAGELPEGEASEGEAADEVDPGADPAEVAAVMEELCKGHDLAMRRVMAERLPRGCGRVTLVPKNGPRKVLDVDREAWAQPPAIIARGLVEAMGGEL